MPFDSRFSRRFIVLFHVKGRIPPRCQSFERIELLKRMSKHLTDSYFGRDPSVSSYPSRSASPDIPANQKKQALGDVNPRSSAAVAVFVIVLVFIAIAIVVGRGAVLRTSNGWGEYQTVRTTRCVNALNDCQQPGTSLQIQRCVPNSITGRGCLDDNGNQTFAPKIIETECAIQCQRSYWLEEEPGPCQVPPLCSIGVSLPGFQVRRRRCVPRAASGVNGCTTVQLSPNPSGGGDSVPVTKQYNVGDVLETREICFQIPGECGQWVSNTSLAFPNDPEEEPTTTPTPTLEGHFALLPRCQTEGSPMFSVLEEGFLSLPLSCQRPDGQLITPARNDPSIPFCFALSESPFNGQSCTNRAVQPSDISDRRLPDDFNPVICPGMIDRSQNPRFILPCRHRPLIPYDYGYGDDLNTVLGSFILLTIDSPPGVVIPLQTPSVREGYQPLFDWERSPTDPLQNVPLVKLRLRDNLPNQKCTPQEVSFNTGVMLLLGVRTIQDARNFQAIVGLMIGGTYRGWLDTALRSDKKVAIWKQASAGYRTPGTFSTQAPLFNLTLVSPLDPSPLEGYPATMLGSVSLTIRTSDSKQVYIPGLTGVIGNLDPELTPIDSLRALLFGPDTEFCTRVLKGEESCNLLNRRATPRFLNPTCRRPELTPTSERPFRSIFQPDSQEGSAREDDPDILKRSEN